MLLGLALALAGCASDDGRPDPTENVPCDANGATSCAQACLGPAVTDVECKVSDAPVNYCGVGDSVHNFEGALGCCRPFDNDDGTQRLMWFECL